ncbi:MAG: CNNM domain-containing protein [Bacteroidota bacterium]
MGLLIFFLLLSLLFSFLCSVWEAVLLSITPSYVSVKEQEGHSVANDLKGFKEDIDRPLSAILTLNTIAHTVGAIGVGAQAGKLYGDTNLMGVSLEAIIAALMTLAILILSEIIPKTIGANFWKSLAPWTVKSLKVLLFVLAPFVWVSKFITKRMKKDKDKSLFLRGDFVALTEIGKEHGVLEEGESNIILNLLKFNKIKVEDIMTPRTVVISADENMTIQDFHNQYENLWFSRIPLFSDSQDNVTGYFLKDELLLNIINNNGNSPLKDIKRKLFMTEVDTPIPVLFNKLMEEREHMALVMDKFGGMAGIVTMEDLIETLLGLEIVDELDNVEDMQALARKNWEKRAHKIGLIKDEENEEPDENE